MNHLKSYNEVANKNSSYGVVFTDMECTLIGGGVKELETWELYGKACKKVSQLIDLILSAGNYFVIVSSSHHDAKERVARKYNIIYDCLSDQNKEKILFFISDVEEKYGKGTIEKFDNISARLIGEKVECIDIVLQKLFDDGVNINTIVGFGDDEKDVDMLFRIQELGGTVATVAEEKMYLTNLFSFPQIDGKNYKDIIKEISEKEHSIDMHILISKFTRNPKNGFSLSGLAKCSELAEIKQQQQDRIDELTLLFENGQIDNSYLQKCLYNAELAFRYFTRYYDYGYGRKIGEGKEILQKIWGISEYHSDKTISSNIELIGIPKIKRLLLPPSEDKR